MSSFVLAQANHSLRPLSSQQTTAGPEASLTFRSHNTGWPLLFQSRRPSKMTHWRNSTPSTQSLRLALTRVHSCVQDTTSTSVPRAKPYATLDGRREESQRGNKYNRYQNKCNALPPSPCATLDIVMTMTGWEVLLLSSLSLLSKCQRQHSFYLCKYSPNNPTSKSPVGSVLPNTGYQTRVLHINAQASRVKAYQTGFRT